MIKEKTACKSFLLRFSCVLLCLPCFIFAGCDFVTQSKTEEVRQQQKIMKPDTNDDAPFACNPSALSKDERVRYSALTKRLIADKQEVKELPDGYALRFAASPQNIKDAAEFITYEKLCCPFFDFNLTVERNNGALWLELRGREGVKDFIKSEFDI